MGHRLNTQSNKKLNANTSDSQLSPESILSLPTEIIVVIFNEISDPMSFLNLSRTCKTLHNISLDSSIQKKAKKKNEQKNRKKKLV